MIDQTTMPQPALDQPDQARLTRQAWALLGQLVLQEVIPAPDLDAMGTTLEDRAESQHNLIMSLQTALQNVQ